MITIERLKTKIFADGADLAGIEKMAAKPFIRGFTTNPTLMRKAGVTGYTSFAQQALKLVGDRPISFEVFADEFDEMEHQALEISSWAPTVNVKIPITNTRGASSAELVGRLSKQGVAVNITAMMTLDQVAQIIEVVSPETPAILSVFAGRIADTGVDPVPLMKEAVSIAAARPLAEILWASPRELLNVFQANDCGCHIITATNDILAKLESSVGKDLTQFSLETVKMFYQDATGAEYTI